MKKRSWSIAIVSLIVISCIIGAGNISAAKYDPLVYKAQKQLSELGYNPGPADGMFGNKTRTAIKRFQQDNNLSPTGELDKATQQKLGIVGTEQQMVRLYELKIDGKYGGIDVMGRVIIPPRFEDIRFPSSARDLSGLPFEGRLLSLIPAKIDGKYGFIDTSGEFIIRPQFDIASLFTQQGLAAVRIDEKWGYIDTKGKMVIHPQFESAFPFYEGVAIVSKNRKYGLINAAGKEVSRFQFDDMGWYFQEGIVHVEKEGKYGYINTKGQTVIPFRFAVANEFHKGVAIVRTDNGDSALINKAGQIITRFSHSLRSDRFYEGVARILFVEKDKDPIYEGETGFINTAGKILITPQFEWDTSNFSEGVAAVQKDDRMGYIDKTGQVIIPLQFDIAKDFHYGRAIVRSTNGAYYFIDKTGRMISRQYAKIERFIDGLAKFEVDGEEGYLDTTGRVVAMTDRLCGTAVVMDGEGNVLWPANIVGICKDYGLSSGPSTYSSDDSDRCLKQCDVTWRTCMASCQGLSKEWQGSFLTGGVPYNDCTMQCDGGALSCKESCN